MFTRNSIDLIKSGCRNAFMRIQLRKSSVKLAFATYDDHSSAILNPITVMHGFLGSKTNWNSLAKSMNQKTKRKVFTLDARNHGDSSHSSEMSYREMAEDVKDFLHSQSIEKSVLIGHSMGGAAMMFTALKYPEIVEKLLVVDMSPIKVSPSLHDMIKILEPLPGINFQEYKSLSEARKNVDQILTSHISSVAIRQLLMMNIVEDEPGRFKWRMNLPVLMENFHTNIAVFPKIISQLNNPTFSGPTSFIAGAESDYVKSQDEASIRKLFPNASFVYIEGAGHWVQSEKPAEFLAAASKFIN